jgi:hypothetical protein
MTQLTTGQVVRVRNRSFVILGSSGSALLPGTTDSQLARVCQLELSSMEDDSLGERISQVATLAQGDPPDSEPTSTKNEEVLRN